MEYIYIAKNPAFQNMVKIGRTKNLEKRLKELSQIVPEPFEYIKTYQVDNAVYAESYIHECLSNIRVKDNREFFLTVGLDIEATVDMLIADSSYQYLKRKFKSIITIKSVDDIPKIVRNTRLVCELTQAQLAEKAGVASVTVARIETGRSEPTMGLMIKLMEAMDCSIQLGLSVNSTSDRQRGRKIYTVTKP